MSHEFSADSIRIVLRAQAVSRSFKGLKVLSEYAVELRHGEILGVFGSNWVKR